MQPVQDIRFAFDSLVETLSFRHTQVVKDEYAVSVDGMKMFGLLELDATFLDCRFSIGVRNAHDKSMRLGIVAGYNVTVCSNMMFEGDFKPVLAKHSKNFNLEDALTIGVDRIQRGWEPMRAGLERKKSCVLTDDQARLIIYQGFVTGNFPIKLMKKVDKEYFAPSYEEFNTRTLWSVENSFTSAFKQLNPIPQYQATSALGNFIKNVSPA